jgi:Fe-S-cluster-containing hydrogenase component 2
MKRISVIPERCSACRICELACALFHFRSNNPKKSAIRVFSLYPNPILRTPIVCRQCDDPECMEACPVGAIDFADETVRIDTELCTGCMACVEACPYGAIFTHPEVDHPIKCDLCSGSPRCVRACPKNALVIVEELGVQPRLVDGKPVFDRMKELDLQASGGGVLRYNDGGPADED